MTAEQFKQEWSVLDDNLRPVANAGMKSRLNLTPEAIEFLIVSGLPDSAAPFLGFYGDSEKKYNSIDILTNWFDFLTSDFSKYVVIGSDGSGDIIALNTERKCIVEWLDHEDYFSSRFMNSSINQLAGCLLVYKQFINLIIVENENTYLNFTDAQFSELQDKLESIDEKVVQEGFWKNELDLLLVNREDEKKND